MNRMCHRTKKRTLAGAASLLLAFASVTWVGCGTGGGTVPVSGNVTHQGQPVTGGSLTFIPIVSGTALSAGKPSTAEVKADGSFVSDGSAVGRHRVSYSAPAVELPEGKKLEPGEFMPQSPYAGLVPKETEVELAKEKPVPIELVAPAGAGQMPPAGAGRTPPAAPGQTPPAGPGQTPPGTSAPQ